MTKQKHSQLNIVYVPLSEIRPNEYNPKRLSAETAKALRESIEKFGQVDPLILNAAPARKNVIVGGHQRYAIYKELKMKTAPCVYVDIPDLEREKELCLRLSKNVAEFDEDLLAQFDENFLKHVGFSSMELDEIFGEDATPEVFNLEKELKKLHIESISCKPGDVYQLGPHRLLCGDSTLEADVLKLMNGEKADMCFTDEPYVLDYTKGKKRSKATEGFGYKRDRKYLGTDTLPPDFMARWLANVNKVRKEDFSIISFENWKNLKQMWEEMEKYFKIRNVIIWHVPNRVQNFAAKYKFFDKFDAAILGTSGTVDLNVTPEEELLQNEYETALFATTGKPHWEPYRKGKKYCPTDFVHHVAADEKNSGQGVVFGTKPVEILLPYVKVLTQRGDLIIEPFGGSGSTLIAAEKLKRRCYVMEKSPVYCEVIKGRWEKLMKQKGKLLHEPR